MFNAFASANAGMDDEESRFGAALAADNNTDEPVYAPFSPTVFGETQMTGGALRLTEDCETVTLSLVYDNQINEAFFGGAALYVGNFGETFDYYTETGLLKSVSNDFGGSIQLQYDSNLNPNKILQQHMGETLKEIDITYDDYHNIIQTQASDITTNYFYNPESIEQMNQDGRATYGVITDIISTAEELVTFESMTYTPDFNYLASYTDARGMTSAFGYDMLSGRLLSATDPNGNTVEYMYSIVPVIEEVGVGVYETYTVEQVSVSGRAETNGPPVTTSFCSTQGVLRVILRGDDLNDLINGSGGDFHYRMEYDELGRVAGVNAGGNPLVANSYDTRQRLSGQTYANGDTYSLLYDSKDRVVGEKYGGGIGNEPDFGYTYNQKNQLSSLVDRENDTLWSYGYDVSGRLVSMAGSNGALARFEHNAKTDKLSRLTVSQNGGILTDVSHVYADDGRPVGAALHGMGESALAYGYDGLNRLRYANLEAGGLSLEHNYSYIDSSYMGVDGIATGLVGQLQLQKWDAVGFDVLREYTYSYDGLGNIESVTDGDGNVTRYGYDGLNRLVREDDELRDVTTTFSYDGGGNLLAKTTYEYTLGSLGSPLGSVTYAYGNSAWADQLTAYDGNAITYDQMGNPTGYAGYTFAWQRGRQLAGISGNGASTSYMYNSQGLRTQKTVNNVTTKYLWIGDLLISQTDGTDTLNFTYDANGRAIGAEYVGVGFFYYLYNLQGDVVAVVGEDGLVYGEYTYDAWGNVLEATGTLAEINPLRYRGYYYDSEIGCYYLQSRYYVPEWGRFLNADCMIIAGNVLTASNLYAYANGNPVMMVDKTGREADWIDSLKSWWDNGGGTFVGVVAMLAIVGVMLFVVVPFAAAMQVILENPEEVSKIINGVGNWAIGGLSNLFGGSGGGLLTSLLTGLLGILVALVKPLFTFFGLIFGLLGSLLSDDGYTRVNFRFSLADVFPFFFLFRGFLDPRLPYPDETWSWQATFPTDHLEGTQGFAVGTTYCYAFRILRDNTDHILYRNQMGTNLAQAMTVKTGYTKPALGHCNDMALVRIGNDTFIYVAAYGGNVTNPAIVKLQYSGNEYWEVARYELPAEYIGITRMGHTSNYSIQFLLRKNRTEFCFFYIPYSNNLSGTLTNSFEITPPSAYIKYSMQTVHYEDIGTGKMYVANWGNGNGEPNKNVILVYKDVNSATAAKPPTFVKPYEINNTSITKFEIEGCGFPINATPTDNRLWFNTDERIIGNIYTDSRSIK